MFLVTTEEMRNFDSITINEFGIPGVVLMENAGRSTFRMIEEIFHGKVENVKVVVICGAGNNGGDGYVIARYLINHGAQVSTFLLSPKDKIKGDALINLRVLEKITNEIYELDGISAINSAVEVWNEADLIVDALLGTGLNSEVRTPFKEAISEINRCSGVIVSVDIPSGVNGDTGKIMGKAIIADYTATYQFCKIGMSIYPGLENCGKIEVMDISIPFGAIVENPPKAFLYDSAEDSDYFNLRESPEAHKGVFGHMLVVGGSPGKTGAIAMAASSGARMGCGLVTVAAPASLNPILETKLTEEMTEPLPEDVQGYLGTTSLERILEIADEKSVMVFGPGLSVNEELSRMTRGILSSYTGPMIIDADGLNCLSDHIDLIRDAKAEIIITPHPGEMARLRGCRVKEVQENRIDMARSTATDLGVWVVLKGAATITASPDGQIWVNGSGNPWMASGGQGDVLGGILGALIAQGLEPEDGVPFGVYIHGLAADRIIESRGPGPVLATEILSALPALLGQLGGRDPLKSDTSM
jgi:NAD(P)H-hydrate epimerase